jgi:Kdo2-lipid IVA lauroyltransferase/acyltransferase
VELRSVTEDRIMRKAQSPATQYAVYLAVRIVVCIVQALPFRAACRFGDFLGWLAYRINKRHREVARENLRRAFPGKYDEAQIDALVRGVYRHFCSVVIEIAHLPRRLHSTNWRQHIEPVGCRELVDRLLSGGPLLIVTGHFGNWEMAGFALGLFGFRTYAIARPLDNPYLENYLRRFREKTGQTLLAKRGDFDQMEGLLRSGGVIATLADQDAGQRGLFVDFFGRPASTHKAVALLALEHGVPMAVVGTPRIDGRYRFLVGDIIWPQEYDKHPDAVRAITQRFTTALERMIRLAPEQYFWLHRRWKHEPPKARRKSAAA